MYAAMRLPSVTPKEPHRVSQKLLLDHRLRGLRSPAQWEGLDLLLQGHWLRKSMQAESPQKRSLSFLDAFASLAKFECVLTPFSALPWMSICQSEDES